MADLSAFISEAALRDYDRLREGSAAIDLGEWAFIELLGEDRKGWLQGQATNDVKSLTAGSSRSFCFCEPTGSLLASFDAWALEDRIVMSTAQVCLAPALERIERMTILEDVEAVQFAGHVFSIQGPSATQDLSQLLNLPALDAGTAAIEGTDLNAYVLRSDRTGMGGWDIWLPLAATALFAELKRQFPTVAREAYEAARIEAGIPKWGVDMGAKTLPPELGPAFEGRNVSYKKGCYTGQEVLMRLHSRGHTNRTWMGLVSETPITEGASVVHRGKAVGTVSACVFSPDMGHLATATLRNEAAHHGEIVRIDAVEAEVRQMPFLRLG